MAQPLKIKPLNLFTKYNPPTLSVSYHILSDPEKCFIHNIKIFLDKKASAREITDEIYREEELYFKHVPFRQVQNLVQMIIEKNSNLKREQEDKNENLKKPIRKLNEKEEKKLDFDEKKSDEKVELNLNRQTNDNVGEKPVVKMSPDNNQEQAQAASPQKNPSINSNPSLEGSDDKIKSDGRQSSKEQDNDVLELMEEFNPKAKLKFPEISLEPPSKRRKHPIEEKKIVEKKVQSKKQMKKSENKEEKKASKKIDKNDDYDLFAEIEKDKRNNNSSSPDMNNEIDEDLGKFSEEKESSGSKHNNVNFSGKKEENEGNPNIFNNSDQEANMFVKEGSSSEKDLKNLENDPLDQEEGNEEEEGQPKLTRVYIEDLKKEFLMDSKGNVYDLDGYFVGKADNGSEDEEEEEEQNNSPGENDLDYNSANYNDDKFVN